jgi:hypothetical protein
MDTFSEKRSAVANFLNTVVDRVFGAESAPQVDKKMQNLAQKQANIRAVSVRKGFQQILARSDEMAQRIEQYKRQRSKLPGEGEQAPLEQQTMEETIVLSSAEMSLDHQLVSGSDVR